MTAESETFQQIRQYLWSCPADFCLIYRIIENQADTALKWTSATSATINGRDDCDRLAAKYLALANHCFLQKRNFILEEGMSSQGTPFCGFRIPSGKITPSPTNALGRKWWHLVVAVGPTRKAGYVVLARVAAKETNEVRHHIREIQRIVRGGFLGQLVRVSRAFVRQNWGLSKMREAGDRQE